jgi:hypothetical protein
MSLDGSEYFRCDSRSHPRIVEVDGQGPPFPDGHPPCPWRWTPVVGLATWGLLALKRTAKYGHGHYMVPYLGVLTFRTQNGWVEVDWHEDLIGRRTTSIVLFPDLLEAWAAFSESVRNEFLARIPELAMHQDYGNWFAGGLDFLHDPGE